jgi:hypothetical protein
MLRAMELILAILGAGPIGSFVSARRRALLVYLCLWAVVFPVQTIVDFSENGSDDNAMYWVFNALILGLGIALNRGGALLAERRRGKLDLARTA